MKAWKQGKVTNFFVAILHTVIKNFSGSGYRNIIEFLSESVRKFGKIQIYSTKSTNQFNMIKKILYLMIPKAFFYSVEEINHIYFG